ncbi:MAG TPA: hypothetical protein VJM82_04090 [Nitrospiraceae bacterium]|nr:hypothetical protein [Nitrospiraceae bacterium]
MFKGVSWMLVCVAGFFWLGVALELQAHERVDFVGYLRALVMATYAFILGLVCLVIIPVWLFVRAKTRCRAFAGR